MHWIELVIDGRGRTREVINFVYFHIEGKGYVMPNELEVRVVQEMGNVPFRPRKEVIETQYLVAPV